jgi:hypothetical protein
VTLTDNQLEKLLKTTTVPKRSKKFEARFAKKVVAALKSKVQSVSLETKAEIKRSPQKRSRIVKK